MTGSNSILVCEGAIRMFIESLEPTLINLDTNDSKYGQFLWEIGVMRLNNTISTSYYNVKLLYFEFRIVN